MQITNTERGPRGINTINGPVLVEPGQTIEADIFAREQKHIEASGWFSVDGDYTDNPSEVSIVSGSSTVSVASSSSELDELRKQLAEREAELAKLKADATPSERDELKKQASELGLEYPGNISNVKLKELIDAKLAA
jgi:hypothetical protein